MEVNIMTTTPAPTNSVPEWLTPGEFLIRYRGQKMSDYLAKSSALRDLDDKRPHAPLVRWDGTQWVMSVFDPNMFPRLRTSHSWTEAIGYAFTWARINRGAGLL